jgi:hypothetical protein
VFGGLTRKQGAGVAAKSDAVEMGDIWCWGREAGLPSLAHKQADARSTMLRRNDDSFGG